MSLLYEFAQRLQNGPIASLINIGLCLSILSFFPGATFNLQTTFILDSRILTIEKSSSNFKTKFWNFGYSDAAGLEIE